MMTGLALVWGERGDAQRRGGEPVKLNWWAFASLRAPDRSHVDCAFIDLDLVVHVVRRVAQTPASRVRRVGELIGRSNVCCLGEGA